jgi:hypothetical protein
MNNSNRKEIHLGDLVQGNEYDLERYTPYQSSRENNLFTNYVYKYANYDQSEHPHLTLYFDKITPSGKRSTGGIAWSPLDKIYPSYSSYTLKDELKKSKEPNALLALDKATSGTEDLKKYIGEFGGGKRKRTTRKQKGCKKKKSRRKQKGCKKMKSKRSKK